MLLFLFFFQTKFDFLPMPMVFMSNTLVSALKRLREFMPQMHQANADLERQLKDDPNALNFVQLVTGDEAEEEEEEVSEEDEDNDVDRRKLEMVCRGAVESQNSNE